MRPEAFSFALSSDYVYRAEVTAGVQRAVGFRRQGTIIDVALRYRFAYSLEHYDSVTSTLFPPWKLTVPVAEVNVRGRIITHRTPEQGKALRLRDTEKLAH